MTLDARKRNPAAGTRGVLVGAVVAAVLIGIGVYFWTRNAQPPQPAAAGVEGLLLPGTPEFEKYRPMVTLTLQKLTLAKNFAGNRMVKVSATIHNGTELWLEAAQIVVTLRNASRTILEQKRFVLAPGVGKPLAPESDYTFTTLVEQIPADWMGDGADVQISGLRFRSQ